MATGRGQCRHVSHITITEGWLQKRRTNAVYLAGLWSLHSDGTPFWILTLSSAACEQNRCQTNMAVNVTRP